VHRSTETHALPERPQAPMGAILRVRGAPSSQAELRLSTGRCVIGAGADVDLVIGDQAISRRHVELTLVPEGVLVQDLGSRNGTFYLGQRVERATLALGSTIRIGPAEIVIDPDSESLADSESLDGYRGLIGSSPAMRKLFGLLHRLEGSLVSVLIEGESGVGKELIARAIHEGSQLADGPLVTVNCGAMSRELVLSELFGHKKGAFTGASESRVGAFEAADQGTLFLDEIGELPLETQPALLRALELGEVKPLGENKPRQVRVRFVAATNRDLGEEIRAGNFREDLFYRLAVVRLSLPPLRERREDIEVLARHFATAGGAASLPDSLLRELANRPWRGNARELRNAVMAFLALGSLPAAPVASEDTMLVGLRQAVDVSQPYQEEKERFVALFSKAYFEVLLDRTGGNQTEAARLCGVERSYLSKLLAKFGVNRGR
jgi:DNA-binding NtrC family response regulator